MRVVVDWDRCEGHGMCVDAAGELFRLDDDGVLHAETGEIPDDLQPRARAAVRLCPVAALRIDA